MAFRLPIRAVLSLSLPLIALSGAAAFDGTALPPVFATAPDEAAPAFLARDPWADGSAPAGAHEAAAAAFAPAAPASPAIGADEIAAAVKADIDRMSRTDAGWEDFRGRGPEAAAGRVAAAFEGFAAVGPGASAYGSREFVRDGAVAAAAPDRRIWTPVAALSAFAAAAPRD